jgi:hypothetical protein
VATLFGVLKNFAIFVANAFISPFHTQTMHIKSFYTQQHCYVSVKPLYPGGIRTRVFLFLRQMRCPLCHAAGAWKTLISRVARFFLVQNTKTGKIYQITTNYGKYP